MKKMLGLLGIIVVLTVGAKLQASEPTGFYALVEEVKLVGNGKKPEGIKIRGVFMGEIDFDNERSSQRVPPKRGWIYFSLPKDETKQRLARIEWMDLENIAKENGSLSVNEKKCIAFGSRHSDKLGKPIYPGNPIMNLLQDKEPQEPIMEYPVNHGMYLLRKDSEPAERLKEAAK